MAKAKKKMSRKCAARVLGELEDGMVLVLVRCGVCGEAAHGMLCRVCFDSPEGDEGVAMEACLCLSCIQAVDGSVVRVRSLER